MLQETGHALLSVWRDVVGCRKGATAVEYGLIIALIVLAIMVAIGGTAGKVGTMWGNIANQVTNA